MASSSGYGAPTAVTQQASAAYAAPTTGGTLAAQAALPVSSHTGTAIASGQVAGAVGSDNSAAGSGPLPSDMEFLSGYGGAETPDGKTPNLGPRPQSSAGSFDDGAGGFDEAQGVAIAKIDVGGGLPSIESGDGGNGGGGYMSGSEYLPPEVQLSRPPSSGGGVGPSQNLVMPPGYPMVVGPAAAVAGGVGGGGVSPGVAVCYLPKPPSLYPGNSVHQGSGGGSQWHLASQGKLGIEAAAKIQYNRSGSRGSDSISGDISQLDIDEKG